MERFKRTSKPKEPVKPDRVKWVNRGGTFRLGSGKIIKPNEVFLAFIDEVPAAFRDVLKPVEPLPKDVPPPAVGHYEMKERPEGNWFDIIDSQGKVVNENALTLDDASELLKKLE